MGKKFFTVTENHIKLLKAAYVSWAKYDELGAPGIDPKRPYGDSDVLMNIAKVIGLKLFKGADEEENLSKKQVKLCERLHRKMEDALQILLSNCEIKVGQYECDEYGHIWQRVND